MRSCMFYLCCILNAAHHTPKQTNTIQYGYYTGARGQREHTDIFPSFSLACLLMLLSFTTYGVCVACKTVPMYPHFPLDRQPHDPFPTISMSASVNGNALCQVLLFVPHVSVVVVVVVALSPPTGLGKGKVG